jgi:NADPH2:quinone reductase
VFRGYAWKAVRFGDPIDVIQLREVSWQDPQPGQVLVRVRTAGAGLPDLLMTAGYFPLLDKPPIGLGEEVAGDVVATASGSEFAIGERIMGVTAFLHGWGGYAEYAYVLEQSAVRVPSSLSDKQAGGFPIGFRTAYAGLVERASLAAGEVLLVLGAAGSAGSAAVQLGKALGAIVLAVAGSAEKLAFARSAGADHAINYRISDVAAEIAELTSGATVELSSLDMLMRNYSAVGVLAAGYTPDEDAAAWHALADLAERKAITTSVGTVYPFADVPSMIGQQGSPPPGKSVVRVSA